MPGPLRLLSRVLGTALFLGGGLFAVTRVARFTWSNTGLLIDYPAAAAWAALLAGAGALLAAATFGPRPRAAAAVIGVAVIVYGLHLSRFRLAVEDAGASERGLLGTTSVPWPQVSRVETGSRLIVVWGLGEDHVRIDAGEFPAQERARLERTLARRVREKQSVR